ncbi:MAG: hypothetical protein ABI629_08615 [bacterium]
MKSIDAVQVGYQAYLQEGGEEFGAVRAIDAAQKEIVIYVENGGDFTVPLHAVHSVHDGKVVLDGGHLPKAMREAIRHAHDREEPGV